MTFTHEGNKTFFNGLVNFEKMRLISNTIRTMRKCRSAQLGNLNKKYYFFSIIIKTKNFKS